MPSKKKTYLDDKRFGQHRKMERVSDIEIRDRKQLRRLKHDQKMRERAKRWPLDLVSDSERAELLDWMGLDVREVYEEDILATQRRREREREHDQD